MPVRYVLVAFALVVVSCVGMASAAEVKIVINQSPWLDGFKKTAEKYERETGEKVSIDAVPYSGILERVRGSLRAPRGIYDLVMLDINWIAEIYSGGFLTPIEEIVPDYQLPDNVLDFDGALYWDNARGVMNARSGKLMTLPITGNPELLYYRKDLFEKHGLAIPQDWDELMSAVEVLKETGDVQYSYLVGAGIQNGLFRFTAYLVSAGGGIFKNASEGDYRVILNSPQSLQALEFYIAIARAGGYPAPAALEQGEIIQLFSTGRVAIANIVAAARGPLTDPESSIVGEMIGVAPIPPPPGKAGAFAAGHWMGGIARNVEDGQKHAALAFLDWLVKHENQVFLFEAGGVPVRSDLEGAADDPLGFLPVLATSIAGSKMTRPIKETAQVNNIVGRYLDEAMLGSMTPKDALNKAAAEIVTLMQEAGYETAALPDL